VGNETVFHYFQEGNQLTGKYAGGAIVKGQLMGKVHPDGSLEFCYHHLNNNGEVMAGRCKSVPRRNTAGQLILEERWQWFTGDQSTGRSVVEEVDNGTA
jgi:hypothetical protein